MPSPVPNLFSFSILACNSAFTCDHPVHAGNFWRWFISLVSSDMAELVGAVTKITSGFLEINSISIDNWGFKFFYKWTTTLLVFCSVLVTAKWVSVHQLLYLRKLFKIMHFVLLLLTSLLYRCGDVRLTNYIWEEEFLLHSVEFQLYRISWQYSTVGRTKHSVLLLLPVRL